MSRIFRFGAFEVDVAAGRLRKRGIRVALRDQPFEILTLLLDHAGEVVTREEIRRRLWRDDVFVDFDNNLNTAVARLRGALGDSADHPRFIETLPKRGYRFLAQVTAAEEPPYRTDHTSARAAPLALDVDPPAREAYLRGRAHLARGTPGDLAQSRRCFEEAIAQAPRFALAYDAMAELYWYFGFFGLAPSRETCATGIYYALRALEIDHTLGETYALLAQYRQLLDYNWAEVDRELASAMKLAPHSPLVRLGYALNSLLPHGRTREAVAQIEAALAKDPASMLLQSWLAMMLELDRQYERALEHGRMLIERDASAFWGHFISAVVHRERGKLDAAIDAQQRAVEHSGGSPAMLGWLGLTFARAERTGEARTVLGRLQAPPPPIYVPPTSVAWIYVGLNEADAAFEWLDKAVDARDPMVIAIKSYPFLDPFRADPRYAALLRKMNLEP